MEGQQLIKLKALGNRCRAFRRDNGYTVEQIAKDTNYGIRSIYAFEEGKCNNAIILLWYISHGFCNGII